MVGLEQAVRDMKDANTEIARRMCDYRVIAYNSNPTSPPTTVPLILMN